MRAPSSLLYSTFAHYLLSVMGLGAAAASVVIPGCGGKVVVDAEGQAGEGGQAGATSSGTGPYVCEPPDIAPELLRYECLDAVPPGGCPASSNSDVAATLAAKMNYETCVDFCCDTGTMTKVACGPDPTAQNCCYTTVFVVEEVCMGRPFVVDGEARTAALVVDELIVDETDACDGWQAPLSPATDGLDDATRRALGEAWAHDALAEHASIASFARFARQLRAIAAPPDLVADAERAMDDEVRHAEMCFGLASAYLGQKVGPGNLACDEGFPACGDRIWIARAAVREGAIGETIAALCAAAAARDARDPVVFGVLSSIAKDEAAHAAIAWRFLAHALGEGDAAMQQAITEELEAARDAFASMVLVDVADPRGALREHGRLTTLERRAMALRVMNEVILPCAAELLVASRWLVSSKRNAAQPASRAIRTS